MMMRVFVGSKVIGLQAKMVDNMFYIQQKFSSFGKFHIVLMIKREGQYWEGNSDIMTVTLWRLSVYYMAMSQKDWKHPNLIW